MERGICPPRGRHPAEPSHNDGPPFDMGPPPGWGPPPPGGWGPPPPGGWGPPPPGGWGPPPPRGWRPPLHGEWGPPPPGGWGPRGPPPPGWGPRGPPPPGWGPRGPPPPGWGPRGPPPPGWGPHPDDWGPHPDDWEQPPVDWGPPPEDWGPHPDDWRPPPEDWGPNGPPPPPGWGLPEAPGWGPEGPPQPWGPDPVPPGLPPLPPPPPVGIAPDPAVLGPITIPSPGSVPPFGFPSCLPPGWTGEPVVEEVMVNPPPDQPEWIKALISAPATETTPDDTKDKKNEDSAVIKAPGTKPKGVPDSAKPKPAPVKPLGLLGKRTFEKPPPGRSTGIISFIGPNFGNIEREDLAKFTFSFDAFFGNPKAMTPGVRVHFTACKEKENLIATDVKVAPGGTENVDPEIYEAVVSQPIVEPQPGERQYPGQVHVTIGPVRTNLRYDKKDSTVTLLKNDLVLINLLTDIVTEKRRATNIKPKIPATFSSTNETREMGVIVSVTENEGVIKSDNHGELPFDIKENLSDVDFSPEDINEEVMFTVITLRASKRAIRIQRMKEPLLLTLATATASADSHFNVSPTHKTTDQLELPSNVVLDTDLYEGIVSQPVVKPTPTTKGYPGQIHANIGPVRTNVTFDHRDCGVTLLKNDHVLINLLIDTETSKKRATNIKLKVPFTFSYTKEQREQAIIVSLNKDEGVLKSEEHGSLPFDTCENISDTELDASDINTKVEFTIAAVKEEKRAVRLRRIKMRDDQILQEQKRREQEEKKKREERCREAERKKKEEAAAALAAAKDMWTPLGFKMRDPDTLDDISKERFEGTVLKAISRTPYKAIKKEPEQETGETLRAAEEQLLPGNVKVKVEIKTEEEHQGKHGAEGKEERISKDHHGAAEGETEGVGGATSDSEMGRVVMTVSGQQKQLPFGVKDLLTTATMLDGDKVRFNIATHRETKEERATYIEILPDSFEESTEQRRHGIVIEFLEDSGLIKCSQNPQLYFHMSEVIEKKKLELNEKVEFSVVPHETAEGGNQAIRIKRYTESVFVPVRKLGGVSTNKAKMTIKLTKSSQDIKNEKPEMDKLKAVVKNLRAKDSKISDRKECGSAHRKRSRSRSRGRSPPRDQFGRVVKRKRSTSYERDERRSRYRHSKGRGSSSSSSRSSSRSRSRERSRDGASKKRTKVSRDRQESHKRRREPIPPPRRGGCMDDELARKKRELEELNEMIAYKKSLVDRDPRELDPGQRTCIDYDHGRIAVPLTEYKPVRSILKNRPEGPDYHRHPPDYYDGHYSSYQHRRYGDGYSDPYGTHPYVDRPYSDCPKPEHPYDSCRYGEPSYSGPPSASYRYTDRYDVYDEPYEDRYYDAQYGDRPHEDLYHPPKQSHSPERSEPSLNPAGQAPHCSTQPPSTQLSSTSASQTLFRPPSPTEPPPRSPSPTLKKMAPCQSPPAQKPPLDRFLDMLNKKVVVENKMENACDSYDLLPHERALRDGRGFSQIVGLAPKQSSSTLTQEGGKKSSSPKRLSVERISEEAKNQSEPYDKIQSLLRTIGLKLSSGDVPKMTNRGQEDLYMPKPSSREREISSPLPSPREEQRTRRTSSAESDRMHSPSPAKVHSMEPLSGRQAVLEYEGFLDKQELQALKKAQKLHNLTKTMSSTPSSTPFSKSASPTAPAQYQQPVIPVSWSLGVGAQNPPAQSSTSVGTPSPPVEQPPQKFGRPPGPPPGPPPRRLPLQAPPGPPPGPPPRRPPGQPPFAPPSSHAVLPFIGQTLVNQSLSSSSSSQYLSTSQVAPMPPSSVLITSSPSHGEQSSFSTTVARCLKVIEKVKSLAVQPPNKQGKLVKFNLPTESEAASSSQTTAEKDNVKTKQKDKLEVYNQLEKKDQPFEMQVHKKPGENDSPLISPGRPTNGDLKNVWICGHSLVFWAESQVKSREVGVPLGMDPNRVALYWKGTQGMMWPQLLPQLHELKVTWPRPDILIMHLGGNDLSTDNPTSLLASVKKDLISMKSLFPQSLLVWSDILPRRVWHHSADSHEIDLVRTTVNRRIHAVIAELGGASLTHDNIRCGAHTGLYHANGIHLSPKGIDLFTQNLQDFLKKWEMEVNKEKN